jgi:hypothetical protein
VHFEALLADLVLLADRVSVADLMALDSNQRIARYFRAVAPPGVGPRLHLLTWWLLRFTHYPHAQVTLDALPLSARTAISAHRAAPRLIVQIEWVLEAEARRGGDERGGGSRLAWHLLF